MVFRILRLKLAVTCVLIFILLTSLIIAEGHSHAESLELRVKAK